MNVLKIYNLFKTELKERKKMAHKQKGLLTNSGEWAKHLRPIGRRFFWKGERQAEKKDIKNKLNNL